MVGLGSRIRDPGNLSRIPDPDSGIIKSTGSRIRNTGLLASEILNAALLRYGIVPYRVISTVVRNTFLNLHDFQ